MIANYHTHTRWCRHADGEIEDYIREALRRGLKALAITDHVPHRETLTRGGCSGRSLLPSTTSWTA